MERDILLGAEGDGSVAVILDDVDDEVHGNMN